MVANKKSSGLALEDDAPDLGAPEWREKFAHAPVRRGRPRVDTPKVMTTLRLDAEVLEAFRSEGPGWQTRINDALRAVVKRRAKRPSSKESVGTAETPARRAARG